MANQINVEISGLPRSGKSVIGAILVDALRKAGFSVKAPDLPEVDVGRFNTGHVSVVVFSEKDTK